MRKIKIAGIMIIIVAALLIGLAADVAADDLSVHAISPGFDIVVGKDVTFKWYEDSALYTQRKFELITSAGTIEKVTTESEYTWKDFPFGTGWWRVKVYRHGLLDDYVWFGTTSKQNFYHYNNVPGKLQEDIPARFEYKQGSRNLGGELSLTDYTIFYEVMKDYTVDLNAYFSDIGLLPQAFGKWDRTVEQYHDLVDHINSLPNVKLEFIELENGKLTVKKGYRWDGSSNPWIPNERFQDIRNSCMHDSLYDLMRMGYLTPDNDANDWGDEGFMNRFTADCLWFMIGVEDGEGEVLANVNFDFLRTLGFGNSHNKDLLLPLKYRLAGLTAWAYDGEIRLHWVPANIDGDDPKDYSSKQHKYNIYRSTFGSSTWSLIGSKVVYPSDLDSYANDKVYYTDHNVSNGEIYYYWIRADDPDYDGDGWTDQEEHDYGPFDNYKYPGLHPSEKKKHYDETLVEAAVPVVGPGNALQLNGVNQYVEANSVSSGLSSDAVTFEAWVYPESQTGKNAILAFDRSKSGGGNYNFLVYDGTNQRFCYYDNVNLYNVCNELSRIVPGHWYHVAVTIDSNYHGVLYVNGMPEATFTASTRPGRTALFSIGQAWGPFTTAQHFKGKIDEVSIWKVARTQAEIQSTICGPIRGYREGMVGHWSFDEPPRARKAYDTTIYCNDGNLYGYGEAETAFVSSDAMLPGDVLTQDITVELDASGNVSITADQIYAGDSDTCGIDSISVFPSSFTCADIGPNTVALTVTDIYGNTSTAEALVTVKDNIAPGIDTLSLSNDLPVVGIPVTLTGQWSDACAVSANVTVDWGDNAGEDVDPTNLGDFTFTHIYTRAGIFNIQVCVKDGDDESCRNKTVTVQYDCSVAEPTIFEIWPPNHKMVGIEIAGVTDYRGNPLPITVNGITQDEPLNAEGDGNTSPDGGGIDSDTAWVRAERAGTGDGRVYEIFFTADDGQGGTCEGTVTVCVPHDKGKKNGCVIDEQRYNSITGDIITEMEPVEFDVRIDLEEEPIKICFIPNQLLNTDPFISLVTGRGILETNEGTEIPLGSEMAVSPEDDACSISCYCVFYTADKDDSEVEIRIEENPTNPVVSGSPGSGGASFEVDVDHEDASSFYIYNETGGKGYLKGKKCNKNQVIFKVDANDLDLSDAKDKKGNPKKMTDHDYILVKIVHVDPESVSPTPNTKVSEVYDISLSDGVTIADGKSVTVTLYFELADSWSKGEFEENLQVLYYDEVTGSWKSDGIDNDNLIVEWDSDSTGTITFETTHLTKFAAASKSSTGSDVSSDYDTQSASSGGGGCTIITENHGMSVGSAIANILIFFLPLIILGVRRKLFEQRNK